MAFVAVPDYAFGQQARATKSGLAQKLSTNLIDLSRDYEEYVARPVQERKTAFKSSSPAIVTDPQYVVIDVLPMTSSALLQSQLEIIGAVNVVAHRERNQAIGRTAGGSFCKALHGNYLGWHNHVAG